MNSPLYQRTLLMLLGDTVVLYLSLGLMLMIRYGAIWGAPLDLHLGPFSVIFVIWVIVFYITGLYDLR